MPRCTGTNRTPSDAREVHKKGSDGIGTAIGSADRNILLVDSVSDTVSQTLAGENHGLLSCAVLNDTTLARDLWAVR